MRAMRRQHEEGDPGPGAEDHDGAEHMQIFDQEVERHLGPLVIRPVSARTDTAAAIGRTGAKIHCGGAGAEGSMHPRHGWIRSQKSASESNPGGFFSGLRHCHRALAIHAFAQHRIGDWSLQPGECPLSVQAFMTVMQKIHTLTDN
ncbi:hypothetical protein [Bradyrhizobium sp. 2S1]|uniref:hypothetical protein n=1 Tax=Bradyrhizobium sp. 2S1 TaxID=1404429 RepID=UPI00140DE462|nr:hypothetical protein [Bradyrhizobium sp. 2S1]MCK7665214.1 hypothetical protein [Bradyrhizobium sp. 2S1]